MHRTFKDDVEARVCFRPKPTRGLIIRLYLAGSRFRHQDRIRCSEIVFVDGACCQSINERVLLSSNQQPSGGKVGSVPTNFTDHDMKIKICTQYTHTVYPMRRDSKRKQNLITYICTYI